jgi:ribonuclease D
MTHAIHSVLISHQSDLQSALRRLPDQPAVAVDTESNSMYAYRERVCLVQLSFPGVDILIDPMSPAIDASELGPFFADASIEKVFHACEYDVISLRRDYGFAFANLFDTMWAARILGWPRVGLADILKERFGVTLDKRWQHYNWGKRPLPADALSYAQLDTHYLLRLRDVQMRELHRMDRLEEANEVFAGLAQAEAAPRDDADQANGFWRVKGVYDLDPAARAVLRELYLYREGEAGRQDRPPFKIMGDRTLIEIANALPARVDQLRGLPGMTDRQIAQHGRQLIALVARGRKAEPPRPPPRKSIDPRVLDRYERLREWRKGAAQQRGVDTDVIISNAALMALAHKRVRGEIDLEGIDGLGPWRRTTYGAAIVEVLR